MGIILWVALGVSGIAVLIFSYRYFSTWLALARLENKHRFIHKKQHHRHSENSYYDSTITGIGSNYGFSGSSNYTGSSPDGLVGGGGEFGGAGASGGWSDSGGGDK